MDDPTHVYMDGLGEIWRGKSNWIGGSRSQEANWNRAGGEYVLPLGYGHHYYRIWSLVDIYRELRLLKEAEELFYEGF
jgi:hypothetical protein